MTVCHAGKIGPDGVFLRDNLQQNGVDVSLVEVSADDFTGSAMIQVTQSGENAIILYGGANLNISSKLVEKAFENFSAGDILLIQNEINMLKEIMEKAFRRGMKIFFNPAPMDDSVLKLPLELVDTFIVNEIEGAMLAQSPTDVAACLREKFTASSVLMTLGARGAVYWEKGKKEEIFVPAEKVEKVVDTTSAGDTFTGFFIAGLLKNKTPEEAMKLAAKAASFCVARPGAADSIPFLSQIS